MKKTFTQEEVRAILFSNDYGFTTMGSSVFEDEPQQWLVMVDMIVNSTLSTKAKRDCLTGNFVLHKVIKLLLGEMTEEDLYINEEVNI